MPPLGGILYFERFSIHHRLKKFAMRSSSPLVAKESLSLIRSHWQIDKKRAFASPNAHLL
jgi:hypothetical protein